MKEQKEIAPEALCARPGCGHEKREHRPDCVHFDSKANPCKCNEFKSGKLYDND